MEIPSRINVFNLDGFRCTYFYHVGYQYIGKSYFESENFQHEIDNFTAELGPLVINVPNAQELKIK